MIDDAIDLVAGSSHTCVIRENNTVWCWGLNGRGEIGNGNVGTVLVPVQVIGLTDATGIEAGLATSCATLADGSAECWGRNDFGQLGDGTPATSESVPVPMRGVDQDIVNVSTSGYTSCATLADTSAVCWGYGSFGLLGAKTPGDSATPVVVGSGDQTAG